MFVTWLIQLTVLNQQPPNIVSELAKENLQLQPIQRTVAAFILLYFSISELSCNASDGGVGWGRRTEIVLDLKKKAKLQIRIWECVWRKTDEQNWAVKTVLDLKSQCCQCNFLCSPSSFREGKNYLSPNCEKSPSKPRCSNSFSLSYIFILFSFFFYHLHKKLASLRYFLINLAMEQPFLRLQITPPPPKVAKVYQTSRL